MVSKIFVLVLIVGTASAATWIGNEPVKPQHLAHKKGCFIQEINDVVPYGTTLTPAGNCYRIHCNMGILDYASCGLVGTDDDKCFVTDVDLSKPYPNCCPDVKCDLDNNVI